MRMEYLQTNVLDGMMEELLEEFEPMPVLDLLVQNNIVDTEGENQIRAKKSRKERVMTTRSALQCKHYDDRWLLRLAEVLESSAWHRTLGEKLKKKTERILKEVEDIQELYSVSEESFLCLSHLLQIATTIQESDARTLLEYFQVRNTNSSDLGKALVKFILCNKIPILRFKEACNEYKLKYLQDINAKHDMILSFPELQGNFLVKLPASRSHKKVSLLESGTLWESSLFPKETNIKLYVFFRGEYDIHFVKLCDEAKSLCLRIKSKRTLDKLLEENEAGVFGANVAQLVYKPINGSKSTPHIRLDFSKSKLENVRKHLSTSVGETSSLSSCSSLAGFEAGYNEEQSTFDYLDMMDRLIQAINISDIELLCEYFNIDSYSVEKIRGSNNPKREFIRVSRQNKIWTSKDMSRLVDAVRSNQLTHLENIISARHNDMSLWPEVAVKITPTKPYHATFTKFKEFILGKKRVSKSEEEEELGMKLLFKVSTESLDKLKTNIDSGRFLQEILTVYKDETGDNALIISQEERKSIELIYDENQFKELLQHGDKEEKSRQHTFDYLDMMDRLIETMDVSDIDLLCKYFNMDQKSLERIQGSINPKREFIHVCRRKKIWTSGDTLNLLEAARSTQLTRLQNIIEDFNDMSLCPEVTLTMKSNAPSGAMAEFEEFLLSSKKRLDTEFRREFKVHLVDCEKGSIVFRLKVPSKDSLDQLIGDIHSGRLLNKLMTMYNERTINETKTILEDGKLSIKLSYDTKEVKDASNILKHNFTIKRQWKQALMRVQTLMEEDFDPFSLIEILTSNGTLTSTEVDALKATAKRKQRVRLFISFLETKEETEFHSFCRALEMCGYYEELAKALSSEIKANPSGYFLKSDLENITGGNQISGEIDEVSQQCSTEEVDINVSLDGHGNWKLIRAATKRFVEEEQSVASVSTHKRSKITEKEVDDLDENYELPSEPSDDSDDEEERRVTFDKFLKQIGLHGKFPGKMTLQDFITVKNDLSKSDYVPLFWQKITSLDFRAALASHLLPDNISMRDFIFSILHCADDFLRQDILEKLSACQLAIPIVLQGSNGSQPEMLLWACRRIIKKWKGEGDAIAREQPIMSYPVFTVSFLRIGDVKLSKSKLLNYMLGQSQGYGSHPFFLTKENDKRKPSYSFGSVECVWFLPVLGNDKEIFKRVTAFYNLRGDSKNYPVQRRFACMSANLVIVIVATNQRRENINLIREIKKISSETLFIAVKKVEHLSDVEHTDALLHQSNWLFVKNSQTETVSRRVCEIVVDSSNRIKTNAMLESIENFAKKCVSYIDIDEHKSIISDAQLSVTNIFKSVMYCDVLEFKQKSFPLQESWHEWVELDKTRFETDNGNEKSFEKQREASLVMKREKRLMQLNTRLSRTMQRYEEAISCKQDNRSYFKYFLGLLHEKVYQTVSDTTSGELTTIVKLEEEIRQRSKVANDMATIVKSDEPTENDQNSRYLSNYQNMVDERKRLLVRCRSNNLGLEHFLREIGQLYEAHEEVRATNDSHISIYPSIVASLITEMDSFELMDGDTGRVPLTWVTAVLDQLSIVLANPKVLVISVVGVQSSGKSTLLNSMFGLRFPVRAGRCTRGLFIRFLKIEDTLANELKLNYIIVVDTEGIRSIDHDDNRFDNELVTFAFSIADLAIFNIEGENIDSDMTGILQIAAHAMMRMKEVDLECRCKIIQQRVSDLTAADRNRNNTTSIIASLDEATKIAAEAEGLAGRYKSFSDVVDLRIEEDLQYIPCLWKGGMSPPNHMYSEKILKIKQGLIRDIRNKKIAPELTLNTFTQRVRDVWNAVKEENFIFNFQDSVRAVDFNQFCLDYNEWVVGMRTSILLKTNECINKLISRFEQRGHHGLDELKDVLVDHVDDERSKLTKRVNQYIENHPRRHSIVRHCESVRQDITINLKDTLNQSLMRLSDEYEIQMLKQSVPNMKRSDLVDVLMAAKATAINLRNDTAFSMSENDIRVQFTANWAKWIQTVVTDVNISEQVAESTLGTLCEKLLLRITKDMTVGNEIQNIISKEGGLQNHLSLMECSNYISDKYIKAWITNSRVISPSSVKKERENVKNTTDTVDIQALKLEAEHLAKRIVENQMMYLTEHGKKYFDSNVFQLVLRKALKELSSKHERFRLPPTVIGKGLLHLCARAFQEVYKNMEGRGNELADIFCEEHSLVRNQFFNFFQETDVNKNASDIIFYFTKQNIDIEIVELKSYSQNIITYNNFTEKILLPWDLLKYAFEREEDLLRGISGLDFLCKCIFDSAWYSRSVHEEAEYYLEKEWEICCDKIDRDMRMKLNAILGKKLDILQKVEKSSSKETHFLKRLARYTEFSYIEPFVEKFCQLFEGLDASTVLNDLSVKIQLHIEKKNKELGLQECFNYTYSSFKSATGLATLCKEVCPMCGAPCDNIITSHSEHFSLLHRPRGIRGATYSNTSTLVVEDCNTSIRLQSATFKCGENNYPCSEYKRLFPNWKIAPSTDCPGRVFWQWVFANHNETIAFRHKSNPADLPEKWYHITRKEAIQSLEDDKLLKTKGRQVIK